MEIFKHRNLALGCASFLISLAISFYSTSLIRIVILTILVSLALILIIVYKIKKKKGMLDFIIKYTPLLFFVMLAMLISFLSFGQNEKVKDICDKGEFEIVATIEEIEYEKPYKTRCIVKVSALDSEKASFKTLMEVEGGELDKGDKTKAKATFVQLQNAVIGYNEKSTYLDNGINSLAIVSEYEIIENGNDNLNFIEKLNFKLCSIFKDNMSREASALYSAVVLGNKSDLSSTVRRDCARVGVSHALALSGMHITIIATLLGFLFKLTPIPRIPKMLLLIISILFFVLLTGASESAVRAGLMMSLFYFFKMVGKRDDSITALFLAVTAICLAFPYMIFSVSLMLSFLALLGCLIASKLIRQVSLGRIRVRPIKFIIASIFTTLFVVLFTLPIIAEVFGTLSLMTPISNLILIPIFTLMIYLGTIMLVFSGVPGVSSAFFFVSENIAKFLLHLIKRLASIDGILVPIYSVLQIIGVAFIAFSLVFLMVSKRKHLKIAIGILCFSFLFFCFGCFYNYIDKSSSTYVSTYNYKTSDFVAVEAKNKLTLVDVSETTTGVAPYALGFVNFINATEIENYIMTDYSSKANFYFEDVSGNIKINNLYLETPKEYEKEIYKRIVKIAEDDGINVIPLENRIETLGATLEFSNKNTLKRSKKRSVSFNISIGEIDFLYLGSASYEILDYFTEEKAYKADVVVFGSYGPTYQKRYKYEMPNAEKAVFYGEARRFADWDLIKQIMEKQIEPKGEPIKFKLNRTK